MDYLIRRRKMDFVDESTIKDRNLKEDK